MYMGKLDIVMNMNMVNLKILIMIVFVCGLFAFVREILRSMSLYAKAMTITKCSNFVIIFGCGFVFLNIIISLITIFK